MNDLQEGGVLSEWNQIGELQVAAELREFIEKEALPGTGIEPDQLWSALDAILHDLAPRNRELLKKRDDLQARIDAWYGDHRSRPIDLEEYKSFLREIGYLLPEGGDFQVSTANVDPEISTIAGPQLVVPVMNARYALNAANARWGSLYDALYGTDAIPSDDEKTPVGGYDPHRGAKVIAYARQVLDNSAPLADGSHSDASGYAIEGGKLTVTLKDGGSTTLRDAANLAGYQGDAASPSAVLLVNHGLHLEIRFDRGHFIGKDDPAGISDVVAESALTTIMDCEDSVAAVDAEDLDTGTGQAASFSAGLDPPFPALQVELHFDRASRRRRHVAGAGHRRSQFPDGGPFPGPLCPGAPQARSRQHRQPGYRHDDEQFEQGETGGSLHDRIGTRAGDRITSCPGPGSPRCRRPPCPRPA